MARDFTFLTKRFILLVILLVFGAFALFLLLFLKQAPGENGKTPGILTQQGQQEQIAPVSRIVAPEQGISVGGSFKVTVQEADAGGSGLAVNECRYSVYDCGSIPCTLTVFDAKRSCNGSFWVFVGEGQSCFSQGKETCRVVVSSKDYAQNSNSLSENQGSIATFGVDLVLPEVFLEPPSFNRATLSVFFKGKVTDNVEVSNCQMVVDKKGQHNVIPLEFSPIPCEKEGENACYRVFGSHTFVSPGMREISLSCWDLAGNARQSESHTVEVVENRAPEISFCRVVPTLGSISTPFLFQAEAADPDQDVLSYQWNVGDGTVLSGSEASYQYKEPGVYRPELKVQDSFKTEARCSTAWVVVE